MNALAHGVHYGVLVVGLLGLLVLLGPQWVGAPRSRGPRDEHEGRVADLRRQIATGSLGTSTLLAPRRLAPATAPATLLMPVVVVASTAAAGVHAAVGPMHFRELVLFGVFFTGSAVAQLGWSVLMVLVPSRRLLVAGLVGNAVFLALWLLTRTVGLPLGLMPSPEAVGPWDLACATWEVVVVIGCAKLLATDAVPRVPAYEDWPSSTRLWLYGSMIVLAALTLSGAHA